MAFKDYFKSFPILRTERLLLRNIQDTDAEEYVRICLNREVQKYMGNIYSKTDLKGMYAFIKNMNGRYFTTKTSIFWAIEVQEEKRFIGKIELAHFKKESTAQLSYQICKEAWGCGYMTEAVSSVNKFAFEVLGLDRLEAHVHLDNIASIKVLLKNSFQKEGILRNYCFGNEIRTDVMVLSVIKEDYFASA